MRLLLQCLTNTGSYVSTRGCSGGRWPNRLVIGLFAVAVSLPSNAVAKAEGIVFGKVTLLPTVALRSIYETNIFHDRRGIADFGGTAEGGLAVKYERTWVDGNASVNYRREQFFGLQASESTSRNLSVLRGQLGTTVRFPTGLKVLARYELIDTEEPVLGSDLSFDRKEIRRIQNAAQLDLKQRLGQGLVDMGLMYRFSRENFLDKDIVPAVDNDTHFIRLRGEMRIFPKTSAFADISTNFKVYQDDSYDYAQDHYAFSLNSGVTGRWSPALSLTLSLGAAAYVYQNGFLKVLPQIKAQMTYVLSALTEVDLNYEHSIRSSTNALFVVADLVKGSVRRKLSRGVTLETTAQWMTTQFAFQHRNYGVWAQTGPRWTPISMPEWEFGASYRYEKQMSERSFLEFDNHMIAAVVQWAP